MTQTKTLRHTKYNYWYILFAVPAFLNFFVFRYLPIFWAIRTSMWDYSLLAGFREFVGLGNFIQLFKDPDFLKSMVTTFKFFLMYVPVVTLLAIVLAGFVSSDKKGVNTLRTLIFIPVVTSYVVVSIVWGMLLNSDVGMVNSMLESIGLARIPFLMNKYTALPTIAMISIWKNVGYSMIILVAGLKGVDISLYDSAYIDGASKIIVFFKITLPMISRQIMFVVIWATMQAFQSFIPVQTLTNGGPSQSTNIIVYHLYNIGFNFGRMGYATAMSIILLILLLLVSVFQMRLFRRDY